MFGERYDMIDKISNQIKQVDECKRGDLSMFFPEYTGEEDPRFSLLMD